MKKIIFSFLFLSFSFNFFGFGQERDGNWQAFKKLSKPEKCWALQHFFIAKKTWKLTQYVRIVTDSVMKDTLLDKDANGGNVDAFRHSYWMALLTQRIGWKRAYRLGKAHEKGNYINYKKNKSEDGTLPDKVASDMDLWNNNVGINIGLKYIEINEDSLKKIVIKHITEGCMRIIKKNNQLQFLDKNNIIIKEDVLKGKWENDKVLEFSGNRKYK